MIAPGKLINRSCKQLTFVLYSLYAGLGSKVLPCRNLVIPTLEMGKQAEQRVCRDAPRAAKLEI